MRAFWPLGSLLAAVWAGLAFGLAEVTSRDQLMILLAAGAGLALYLLYRGVRRLRWPSIDAARARVDATLPGRPLAALRDTPALGATDPGAQAVWAAHIARMRRLAAAARAVRPDPRLSSRDPWALRLAALVALIAALVFAQGDGLRGVPAALAPGGAAAVAAGPSFEGWAEPPAYTGRPTLYLPEVQGGEPLSVPVGTKITLRVYGDGARFTLAQTVTDAARGAGRGGAGYRGRGIPGDARRNRGAGAGPRRSRALEFPHGARLAADHRAREPGGARADRRDASGLCRDRRPWRRRRPGRGHARHVAGGPPLWAGAGAGGHARRWWSTCRCRCRETARKWPRRWSRISPRTPGPGCR